MFRLQRFLSIANLIAILFAALVLSAVHYQQQKGKGIEMGERENVAFSRILQNTLKERYMPLLKPHSQPGNAFYQQVALQELSHAVLVQTIDTSVIKLKIYNTEGRVVFSTHQDEIGGVSHSEHFRKALQEGIYTLPKSLEPDNRFGPQFTTILETYIPIGQAPDQPPIGVFEVYSDITAFDREMQNDVITLTSVQVGIMLVLYLYLLLIGRRADSIISRQEQEQNSYLQEIEEARTTLEQRVAERTTELTCSHRELLDEMQRRERSDERGRKFFQAVEQSPAAVIMTDAQGVIEYVNPRFCENTGYSAEEAQGATPRILKSGRTDPAYYRELWQTINSGHKWHGEFLNRKKDGDLFWEEVTITPIKNERSEITHHIAIKEDVTEAKSSTEQLRIRDRAIEACHNAICILDAQREMYPIVYVNPSFSQISGFAAEQVLGRGIELLFGSSEDVEQVGRFYQAQKDQTPLDIVLRCAHRNGDTFWAELNLSPVVDDHGNLSHFVVIIDDITDRKQAEQQLIQLATHDTLTGLPNRSLLYDRLQQTILHTQRNQSQAALLFVDLDHFKLINDNLGHSTGDALLKEVSSRLQQAVRECDTVGRQGGDEFVIVLSDLDSEVQLDQVLDRILGSFQSLFAIDEHALEVTCSIGFCLFPTDGADVETLFRHADIAMYQAKDAGRNNAVRFRREMGKALSDKAQLISALRHAVELNQFQLYYQPKLDLASGRIVGAEALIRWQHPEMGLVPPVKFIGVAEESGLILPIGEWVLLQACRDAKAWQDAGLDPVGVAVNLSARQLQRQDVVGLTRLILKQCDLKPQYLDLEITESMVMENPEQMVLILKELRSLGVTISIDDFGTGYSSLSYLKRFPIDRVKIDRSFVQNITTDADDAAIANATISMSHSLRCRVVAEGVESAEQLLYLRGHNCDEMQGYFFSPPVPEPEFAAMLREQRCIDFSALVAEQRLET